MTSLPLDDVTTMPVLEPERPLTGRLDDSKLEGFFLNDAYVLRITN